MSRKKSKTGRKPEPKGPVPPPGFDLYLGLDRAHGEARSRLKKAASAFQAKTGISPRVRSHVYRDGSMDAELTVDLPRKMDPVEAMKRLEESFGTENSRGLWFQVGANFTTVEREGFSPSGTVDRRRGLEGVGMHYRRMWGVRGSPRTAVFADAFGTMESRVIPAMRARPYSRKVESLYIRVHWNPEGTKPRR